MNESTSREGVLGATEETGQRVLPPDGTVAGAIVRQPISISSQGNVTVLWVFLDGTNSVFFLLFIPEQGADFENVVACHKSQ